MARTKRKVTAEEIKSIARRQMADRFSGGFSLRGIARELDVTAPAIYNYFPSMDDLITALIVDAFNGLADAVDAAVAAQAPDPVAGLRAGMIAYREWAVEHQGDFQLIYGNPIPGYKAPKEVTVPLAIRPQVTFYTQLLLAWQDGRLKIPSEYADVPQGIAEQMERQLYVDFPQLAEHPKSLFIMMNVAWARIHGMVMLEIHEHTPSSLGDIAAFYALEVDAFLMQLGLA